MPGCSAATRLRRDEWIILSAHYDHLGVRGGVLYPGADDNASGVAMMLEVARALVHAPERPRRSVMFIGFDLEEVGLFGSRYFVEHPPVPLDRVKLFVTADMIGRALGGVCTSNVFVMGTEHAPELRSWIESSARAEPLTVGLLGSDLLVLNRSDYGPFRARKIPYLFFSTGENPCYHAPEDTAETLNYPKLAAISRVILGVVRQATLADQVPAWRSLPDNPLAEAVAVRDVLREAPGTSPGPQDRAGTNPAHDQHFARSRCDRRPRRHHPCRADHDGQRRQDRSFFGVLNGKIARDRRLTSRRWLDGWARGGDGGGGTRCLRIAAACCSNSGRRGMNGGAT